MRLKATVESLEQVEEQYRGLYEERDGVFRLSVEGVEFEDDVKGLRSALEKERKARRDAEKRLGSLPADFDPEKWAELTEAQKRAEEDKAKQAGKWDDWKKQLQEQHAKELRERDEKLGTLQSRLNNLLVTSVAAQEIAKLEGSTKLLMPHIERMTKVVDVDGEPVARVVDEHGQERLGKSGEPMTIAELVSEMRESDDFAAAFKGSGASGGGAAGRSAAGGSGRGRVRTKADLNDWEKKAAFIEEHGAKAYAELPDK